MDPITAGMIGSAAIGAGASLLGGGLQFGANTASTHSQYKYQKKLMGYQYRLQQRSYLESPTAQRTGLENAGYNPLIPFMGSGNMSYASPGLGSTSALGTEAPDLTSGASKAAEVLMQKRMNEAQIKSLEANTALTGEQTKTEQFMQQLRGNQAILTQLDSILRNKEIEWYDKRQVAETQSMLINAIAHQTESYAAQSNANTAAQNLQLQQDLTAGEREGQRILKEILNSGVGDYGYKYDWVRNHYPNPGNAVKALFGLSATGFAAKGLSGGFSKFNTPYPYSNYVHRNY